MELRILHFSDFHLDGSHIKEAETLLHFMCKSLEDKKGLIDLIVFTGDMVNQGGHGFENLDVAFSKFDEIVITKLCEVLGLPKERFIFVPGNHDIDYKKVDKFAEKGIEEDLNEGEDHVADVIRENSESPHLSRAEDFKSFERNFYTPLYSPETYSHSPFQSNFILEINGMKVGVTSLNTVWRCGPDDKGKLVMGLFQIDESQPFLKGCQVKIAATHYRYDKMKEFEVDPLKMKLADNYDIFLSGHTHSNYVGFIGASNGNSFFDVNTAGTLAANNYTNDKKHTNAYQIITYSPGVQVEITEYCQSEGSHFAQDMNFGTGEGRYIQKQPGKEDAKELARAQAEKERLYKETLFHDAVFPIDTLSNWRPKMSQKIFHGKFETNDKIERIKASLVDESVKKLRLMALSGMGKTRIVFDVFAGKENVYYTPIPIQPDELGKIVTFADRVKEGVLIIDNCPIAELTRIQKFIMDLETNIRVISIYNSLVPDERRGQNVLILDYHETGDIIDKILNRENILKEKEELKSFIKKRSGNIPYMAVLMVDAYKKCGNVNISNKDLLHCLLNSAGKLNDNQEKAVKALSLFEPLGIRDRVSDEYDYVKHSFKLHKIAKNQDIIDKTFENTIRTLRSCQLLEIAGHCLHMRPRPLAEWLTETWMEDNPDALGEVYEEITNLGEPLSTRLTRAMNNRFEEMTNSDLSQQIFDQYNNPDNGPFHNERIAFSKSGSQLFLSMGVVSPVMVAKNLESLIYAKQVKWLRDSLDKDARRNLIWGMEKIVINADAFEPVAKSLGRLALAENESYANNATGQFLQLFHIFLPGMQTNLNTKLKVLNFFEAQDNCDDLLIKAVDSALVGRHFSSTYTANNPVAKNTTNYSVGVKDVYNYWTQCLDILDRIVKRDKDKRVTINSVLARHVLDFQHLGKLRDYLGQLEIPAQEVNDDWDELRGALNTALRRSANRNDEDRELLESWIQRLTPKTFYRKMQTYMKDMHLRISDWKKRDECLDNAAESFVDKFIEDEIYKTEEFREIIKDKHFTCHFFVKALAQRMVIKEPLLQEIVAEMFNTVAKENCDFESPFIISFARLLSNEKYAESLFKHFYDTGYFRLAASIEGIIDSDEIRHLDSVIEDVKSGKYDDTCTNNYLLYANKIDMRTIFDNFRKMSKNGINPHGVAYPYILDFIFVSDILKAENARYMKQYKEFLLDYPFSVDYVRQARDVVERMGDILDKTDDADFAFQVHSTAVKALVGDNWASNPFEFCYFHLLPKYQDAIMDDLIDILAADDIRARFFLEMYMHLGSGFDSGKGPLFQCNEEKIKNACKRYSYILPERLALMCPVYDFDANGAGPTGISSFFLWLCDNYGDNEQMLVNFGCNMRTYSRMGADAYSPRVKQDVHFIEPLLSHKNAIVRKWAESQYKMLNNQYQRESDNEAYSFMVRGF